MKGIAALALALPLLLVGCGKAPTTTEAASEAPAESTTTSPAVAANADAGIQASEESPDVLVPGTDYHATTRIHCGFDGKAPTGWCDAGVKRKWGDDGTNLVEVKKPDGRMRALYFHGTDAYGADSAQADGSAGFDFKVERKEDNSLITFGPERYEVPDALVVGG